jgi:hypothetical protein
LETNPYREGTLVHVKGFIMNKLFEKGCFGRGGSHGRHMTVRNLREEATRPSITNYSSKQSENLNPKG